MSILRWGPFAEIAIKKMAFVKPGENLLIVADTWTDMDLANACLVAGINAGAVTQMLVIPRVAHGDVVDLSQAVQAAIINVDVVLGICETMFVETPVIRKARLKGTRVASVNPHGMEDFAIEGIVDVNYEGLVRASKIIAEMYPKTKICRVKSSPGTDITFSLLGRPVDIGDGIADQPGKVTFFPGPDIGVAPVENTINGLIVVDGCIDPPGKLVHSPLTMKIENGFITSIEGGADAASFRASLESVNHPNAFALCHFTLGLNPRAKPSNSMHETEHIFGAVTFGFGDQDPAFQGTVGEVPIHSDVVILSPSIYLDGVLLFEKNVINPELKIFE